MTETEPVQTALWKEEVTDPSPELEMALTTRAAMKQALEEFGEADKEAKDAVRQLARDMEAPREGGQIIITVGDTRFACHLKAHTRVSIKELAEED
jgi:hypothetical protein